jgi:hypothetical protein
MCTSLQYIYIYPTNNAAEELIGGVSSAADKLVSLALNKSTHGARRVSEQTRNKQTNAKIRKHTNKHEIGPQTRKHVHQLLTIVAQVIEHLHFGDSL